MAQLDVLDRKILLYLQEDAHLTTKELASKLSITSTPVHERIKRLERDGYITRYVALVDKHKVERSLVGFCNVWLKEHSHPFLRKFEQGVLSLQEVTECYHIAGNFDYLLKVMVKDMDAYQHFIVNKLAKLDNIGNVQSSFAMTEIKHSTVLPLE